MSDTTARPAFPPQPLPVIEPRGFVTLTSREEPNCRVAFHRSRIVALADAPGGGTEVVLANARRPLIVEACLDEVLEIIALQDGPR